MAIISTSYVDKSIENPQPDDFWLTITHAKAPKHIDMDKLYNAIEAVIDPKLHVTGTPSTILSIDVSKLPEGMSLETLLSCVKLTRI